MKRIKLYAANGEHLLEFGFNNPSVEYKETLGWVVINASGRTITLGGTSMLAYDDEIAASTVVTDLLNIWKNNINAAYQDNDKVLAIFSSDQVPVMTFHGKNIKFISKYNDLITFSIDDKPVWVYNMNFMILSRN